MTNKDNLCAYKDKCEFYSPRVDLGMSGRVITQEFIERFCHNYDPNYNPNKDCCVNNQGIECPIFSLLFDKYILDFLSIVSGGGKK